MEARDLASANDCRAHLARGRAMSGRTGCGLCGIEDFSQMPSPRPPLHPQARDRPCRDPRGAWRTRERASLSTKRPAPSTLRRGADGTGPIVLSREDVGRHNALDKTIGALCARGRDAGQRFLCHHQPLFVRNGGQGGDLWRRTHWSRSRRRPRSRSSGLSVLAFA